MRVYFGIKFQSPTGNLTAPFKLSKSTVASWLVRSSPGLDPCRDYFVVFSGKTLTVPPHPGVQMGTGEFNAGGNPSMD